MQLGPLLIQNVEHVSFSSHRVLASVASGTSEEHDLVLSDNRDGVAESRLGNLPVDFDILNELLRGLDSSCASSS